MPHQQQLRTASVCVQCNPASRINPTIAGSPRRAPRSSSFRRARQPPHRRASLGSFCRAPRNSSFGRTRQPAQRRTRIALMRRIVSGQQSLLQCRDRLRSCRVFVVDNQIGNDGGNIVGSHRRSATSTPPLPRVRLTSLIALHGEALRHASSTSTSSPGAVASTRSPPRRRTGNLPALSNQSLSKITKLTEIVGSARASHLIATICGGATSCVEARDWAAFEAKDPMVRVSQDPLLLMRHITPFSRGAALRAAGHRGR
jgi:hypothetical protein